VGHLQDAVGQRRLAVVDVGDDREVADVGLVGDALEDMAVPASFGGGRRSQLA
jgi:hypothetical protein